LRLSISYIHTYIVATGRTDDKPTTVSLRTDDNGTPATWTLVLFQQAIDRQDRTPVEGRFSYWNYWRYNSLNRNLSHYRTRTRRKTTCLVGHPSIEATPAPADEQQRVNPEGSSLLAGDRLRIAPSLRIAPGHSKLQQSSRLHPGLPTTDINHRLLGMGIVSPVYPIWQPTGLFFGLSTAIHVQPSTLGGPNRCEATGNQTTPVCQQSHGSISCTSNSVCVFIVFCNIPQTTESLLLYSVALFIPQE